MLNNDKDTDKTITLSQAHDYVKKLLTDKWITTHDFFKQHYGSRDISDGPIDR